MKIVFVNKTLLMGGIEKCIELLAKELKDRLEIEVVYLTETNIDYLIVDKISKYCKVSNILDYENQPLTCDVCIWCSLYFDYHTAKKNINADRYFAWVHSMPRTDPNCLLDDEIFVNETDKFICVSEAVKNKLAISKEGIVIHNFLDNDINDLANGKSPFDFINATKETLKLVTVSRLSRGKGFERVAILANNLTKLGIDYKWIIVGNGRSMEQEIKGWFKSNSNVIFAGKQSNPYPYIKNADYLVQLSDDESWGIVITEALALHTPVIVTDFDSSKEQVVNLQNGIIVKRTDSDYTKHVDSILNNKIKLRANLTKYSYINETEKWLDCLTN